MGLFDIFRKRTASPVGELSQVQSGSSSLGGSLSLGTDADPTDASAAAGSSEVANDDPSVVQSPTPPAWSLLAPPTLTLNTPIHRTADPRIAESLRSHRSAEQVLFQQPLSHLVTPSKVSSGLSTGLLRITDQSPLAGVTASGADLVLKRKPIERAELSAADAGHARWPILQRVSDLSSDSSPENLATDVHAATIAQATELPVAMPEIRELPIVSRMATPQMLMPPQNSGPVPSFVARTVEPLSIAPTPSTAAAGQRASSLDSATVTASTSRTLDAPALQVNDLASSEPTIQRQSTTSPALPAPTSASIRRRNIVEISGASSGNEISRVPDASAPSSVSGMSSYVAPSSSETSDLPNNEAGKATSDISSNPVSNPTSESAVTLGPTLGLTLADVKSSSSIGESVNDGSTSSAPLLGSPFSALPTSSIESSSIARIADTSASASNPTLRQTSTPSPMPTSSSSSSSSLQRSAINPLRSGRTGLGEPLKSVPSRTERTELLSQQDAQSMVRSPVRETMSESPTSSSDQATISDIEVGTIGTGYPTTSLASLPSLPIARYADEKIGPAEVASLQNMALATPNHWHGIAPGQQPITESSVEPSQPILGYRPLLSDREAITPSSGPATSSAPQVVPLNRGPDPVITALTQQILGDTRSSNHGGGNAMSPTTSSISSSGPVGANPGVGAASARLSPNEVAALTQMSGMASDPSSQASAVYSLRSSGVQTTRQAGTVGGSTGGATRPSESDMLGLDAMDIARIYGGPQSMVGASGQVVRPPYALPDPGQSRGSSITSTGLANIPNTSIEPRGQISEKSSTTSSSKGALPTSEAELEVLAGKIYERIRHRLRRELLHNRERAGLTLDGVR